MLATTTLADAPTIVALPPRQAPSASDHHSGSIGIPDSPSCWTTGIIVAVYGMLSMIADAMPRDQRSPSVVIVASPPVTSMRAVGDRLDDPDVDDRLDQHEQADEEEQGRPLDFAQGLLDLETGQQEQDRRTEQGDRARLETERRGQQEPDRSSRR